MKIVTKTVFTIIILNTKIEYRINRISLTLCSVYIEKLHIFFHFLYSFDYTYNIFKSFKRWPETHINQTVVNNVNESNNRSDQINYFRSTINHRHLLLKISTLRFSRVLSYNKGLTVRSSQ